MTASLVASFLSKGWSALLSLAFVPLYIRLLGVEAYGLIGAFLTLQSFLYLLDLGLGAALTREMARSGSGEQRLRDLLRTLELIYGGVALLIAGIVALAAPLIASHWLKAGQIPVHELTVGLQLAGVAYAFQWPTNLYSAGLMGLHRQVLLGGIVAGCGTARALATLAGLWLVAPSLQVFFVAQAAGNLVQTVVLREALWRSLPGAGGHRPAFDGSQLRPIFGFATGMTGISLTSVILTQLDKIVLSKTLSLESFGYYAVASTLASSLLVVVSPMFSVLFPRFAELAARGDVAALSRLYHLSSQLMAVIVWPLTMVLALCASRVLLLWSGSAAIAENSHLLLTLIVVGNALNGLMNVPYALQLAHGWTRLALITNICAVGVCAPLAYFLSVALGAVGGALVWLFLMVGVTVTEIYFTHRRFGLGPTRLWYISDVGIPGCAALLLVASAMFGLGMPRERVAAAAWMVCLLAAAAAAAVIAAPRVRGVIRTLPLPGLR